MKENSSSQMGRNCRQWLLKIRICCHDSDYLSDSGTVHKQIAINTTKMIAGLFDAYMQYIQYSKLELIRTLA